MRICWWWWNNHIHECTRFALDSHRITRVSRTGKTVIQKIWYHAVWTFCQTWFMSPAPNICYNCRHTSISKLESIEASGRLFKVKQDTIVNGWRFLTCSRISQLPADYICLRNVPAVWTNVITHCPPCLTKAYFHSSFMGLSSVHQPYITIIADDIWEWWLCIIRNLTKLDFITSSALDRSVFTMVTTCRCARVYTVNKRGFIS